MYALHSIESVEGIGPAWGAELQRLGLTYSEDLVGIPLETLHSRTAKIRGFPRASLGRFQTQAALVQVERLSPQHAEALAAGGVVDLEGLAGPHPSAIVEILDRAVEEGRIPSSADADEVLRWQKRALEVHHTGTLTGEVLAGGAPVEGAVVRTVYETAVTDAAGRFWLPVAPYGRRRVVVSAQGHAPATAVRDVEPGGVEHIGFRLLPEESPRVIDEAEGRPIARLHAEDHIVFVDRDLAELPPATPLALRYRYTDGDLRLSSLHRRRIGHRIEVDRVRVPGDLLPPDLAPGQVVRIEGGALVPTGETAVELSLKKLLGDLLDQVVRRGTHAL